MSAIESLEEARAQALLEARDVGRARVGGEDDLATGGLEGVEGVEELLLGALLAGDELDVVEEEDVDATEGLPKDLHPLAANAVDELVDELLGGHVDDAVSRLGCGDAMGDGVQEVGLAEPGAAVEEERVVGVARVVRRRPRRPRRRTGWTEPTTKRSKVKPGLIGCASMIGGLGVGRSGLPAPGWR